jgi:hypothetical protein
MKSGQCWTNHYNRRKNHEKTTSIYYRHSHGVSDLNDYLHKGWEVVQTCPMPSSIGDRAATIEPTCLAIIEINTEGDK